MLPMLRFVLGNLLKRPATLAYPAGPKPAHPGGRGRVAIAVERCVFCGLCARKCPTSAIGVDRPGKRWTIRRHECVVCSCCVEVCPTKCLSMAPEASLADRRRTEDSFGNA